MNKHPEGVLTTNYLIFFCFPLLKDISKKVNEDDNSVLNTEILNNAAQIYSSPYENRLKIYSDLKNRSFIYCWFNNITGDFYIGSTKSGKIRFQAYLSPGRVGYAVENPKNVCSDVPIRLARSIIQYGYDSFLVAILEFLDNDLSQEELIKREQYYLNLYSPIYNLSSIAGIATPYGRDSFFGA